MSSYERRHPAPVASSAAALPPAARASKAPDPARAVERPSEESVAAWTVPPTPARSAPSSFVRSQTLQASPSQTLAAAYPLLRKEKFDSIDRDGQKPCPPHHKPSRHKQR